MRFKPSRVCLGTEENKPESKPHLSKAEKQKMRFLIREGKTTGGMEIRDTSLKQISNSITLSSYYPQGIFQTWRKKIHICGKAAAGLVGTPRISFILSTA